MLPEGLGDCVLFKVMLVESPPQRRWDNFEKVLKLTDAVWRRKANSRRSKIEPKSKAQGISSFSLSAKASSADVVHKSLGKSTGLR